MVGLELSGVQQSWAEDVSHDGSVIVGDAMFDATGTADAFIWTAEQGMRRLKEVLVDDYGLAASLSGWTELGARAISADGRTIVGRGRNPFGLNEAFLAHLDPIFPEVLAGDYNHNGIVEQADLDLVLLNWGRSAATPPTGWTNNLPAGLIDQDELDGVLLNWGNTPSVSATTAVPEPITIAISLVCLVTLIAAKRRHRRAFL
jgi:uncharacterized membrane protein